MIKIFLTISIVFTFFITAKCQTTIEEYNYVTKGYQIQVESGLDMKKGYEIKEVDRIATNDRVAEYKQLLKVIGTRKLVAAHMLIYQRFGKPKEYICIPTNGSSEELNLKYWASLNGSGDNSDRLQIIAYLLSRSLRG